ncbi:MAG: DNA methyltransferase [Chloroflexota bacterium]
MKNFMELKPLIIDLDDLAPVENRKWHDPSGYQGLYAFHKYWGKKPHELLAFIIERMSSRGEVVVDPFVGSGTAAREALLLGRRFIGCDINPVAIELTKLLSSPPNAREIEDNFDIVTNYAKARIMETYRTISPPNTASHFLWEGNTIKQVWHTTNGRKITKLEPTAHDLNLSKKFEGYKSSLISSPQFFTNTRINAGPDLNLNDLFTDRAIHNIDLLLEAIQTLPLEQQKILMLCLTAASGQMSKMVFAVTNRGKRRGETSSKVEVGSWVIGYWRPPTRFEVNVWNCFSRRVEKLISALATADPLTGTQIANNCNSVISGNHSVFVGCMDCRELLANLPHNSIDLIITDPPHSDRIPYLELSAMWNSLLSRDVNYKEEIVVSNAKERGKVLTNYTADIQEVINKMALVLKPSGIIVFLFNARSSTDWAALQPFIAPEDSTIPKTLHYIGSFPAQYSAGSVIQDNREGGLKYDYALVFSRNSEKMLTKEYRATLSEIPGWSKQAPSIVSSAGTTA